MLAVSSSFSPFGGYKTRNIPYFKSDCSLILSRNSLGFCPVLYFCRLIVVVLLRERCPVFNRDLSGFHLALIIHYTYRINLQNYCKAYKYKYVKHYYSCPIRNPDPAITARSDNKVQLYLNCDQFRHIIMQCSFT